MNPLLQQRLSRAAALRPVAASATAARHAESLPAAAEELARMVAAVPRRNTHGEYLAVQRWFEGHDCPSGHAPLAAPLRRLLVPLGEMPPEALDPAQWLFLDTETTGLAGGSGTYAFLVGLAWWDAGGLEVEQLFLRDYSEEHAVLEALAARMAERRVLVTFNGRSFDWPLLETRYRMTRRISAAAPAAHLDLLHPARQIWRLKLGSVRLMELERHVLLPLGGIAWQREGDIPGALIPQ
ncbi:MAG TPA: ribonuclease H-like domain-containing protein, partial [Candidatus Acidoferrales bacterium]|nr:ribonuclease H-like domain-containing protein [Candidatus Acidoferrales bacterium]